MIKRFILFLIIILTAISCNFFDGPKKPKNLISKKKMVEILIDARLIGSATSINEEIMQKNGVKLDTYVFEKHGIDSLQFALSNEYYAYRIKEYEEIYNKVIDSLEKLKEVLKKLELKEEKEKKKIEEDSINFLNLPDSLKIKIKKDSLTERLLKKKLQKEEEGVLIEPISEKGHLLHK